MSSDNLERGSMWMMQQSLNCHIALNSSGSCEGRRRRRRGWAAGPLSPCSFMSSKDGYSTSSELALHVQCKPWQSNCWLCISCSTHIFWTRRRLRMIHQTLIIRRKSCKFSAGRISNFTRFVAAVVKSATNMSSFLNLYMALKHSCFEERFSWATVILHKLLSANCFCKGCHGQRYHQYQYSSTCFVTEQALFIKSYWGTIVLRHSIIQYCGHWWKRFLHKSLSGRFKCLNLLVFMAKYS